MNKENYDTVFHRHPHRCLQTVDSDGQFRSTKHLILVGPNSDTCCLFFCQKLTNMQLANEFENSKYQEVLSYMFCYYESINPKLPSSPKVTLLISRRASKTSFCG